MLVHAYLTRVAAPQLTTIVLWHARLSFMDILGLMARRFDMPVAPDDLGACGPRCSSASGTRPIWAAMWRSSLMRRSTCPSRPSSSCGSWRTCPLPGSCPSRLCWSASRRSSSICKAAPPPCGPGHRPPATLAPLTEAESLAYIRQHVAKRALPGGQSLRRGPRGPGPPRPGGAACPEPPVHRRPAGWVLGTATADYRGARPAGPGRVPGGQVVPTETAGLRRDGRPRARGEFLWVAPFHPRPQASIVVQRRVCSLRARRRSPRARPPAVRSARPQARATSAWGRGGGRAPEPGAPARHPPPSLPRCPPAPRPAPLPLTRATPAPTRGRLPPASVNTPSLQEGAPPPCHTSPPPPPEGIR